MSKTEGLALDLHLTMESRVFISGRKLGGAYRDRTDDPLLAKQVLSQLS
jgi:hypothetical protein